MRSEIYQPLYNAVVTRYHQDLDTEGAIEIQPDHDSSYIEDGVIVLKNVDGILAKYKASEFEEAI